MQNEQFQSQNNVKRKTFIMKKIIILTFSIYTFLMGQTIFSSKTNAIIGVNIFTEDIAQTKLQSLQITTEREIDYDTEEYFDPFSLTINIKNAVYIHNEDLIDFKMMQFSDHNIISNSSFSWWAAWLNDNDRKQIISPKKENWFGEFYSHYNMNDLIPEDWEQI